MFSDPLASILSMAASMMMGQVLPVVKFFKPNTKFVEWMKTHYTNRRVYDVGAGCGHVAAQLAHAGLTVTAIDCVNRDEEDHPIELADATSYMYHAHGAFLICRPCHGPFALSAIMRARTCGIRYFIYVGLPKNTRSDLGVYRKHFRRILTNVGEDHESLYEWKDA